MSGELSHGDRDGSYGSARAVDQTRKSRGADKGFTSGRAYRPLDRAWLNLFCAGTLGASCRDGDGDFNQLCPRGVVPFLVFS